MTTPQAPGAPEGGQNDVEPTAPGAQDPAPQQDPKPAPKPLGKPNQPTEPEPAGGDDDPQDVESLPDWAKKALKKARADAGNARTAAKQKAADEAQAEILAKISKTLGLDVDGEPTVDDLTKQLEERQARISELEAAQTETDYRDAVRAAASAANADPDALLDSAGFRNTVLDELDDDFTDDDLAAAVKKTVAVYAKKPRFAKTAVAARSGGDITGAPPPATKQRPRSLTEALNRDYGLGR